MSEQSSIVCTVYRCTREKELYIYVNRTEGLARVPETLLQYTGPLSEVLTLKLGPTRKLARVKAPDVLQAIADKGYFLQLPPDKQPTQFTLGE